jgi:hypothetical protein
MVIRCGSGIATTKKWRHSGSTLPPSLDFGVEVHPRRRLALHLSANRNQVSAKFSYRPLGRQYVVIEWHDFVYRKRAFSAAMISATSRWQPTSIGSRSCRVARLKTVTEICLDGRPSEGANL